MSIPPAFLVNCAAYHRYLEEVPTGKLILPRYETGPDGIIVTYGEAFCRFPNCSGGLIRFKSTPNLRKHLRLHLLVMAPSKPGGLLQNEKDEAAAWYEGLFKGDEDGVKEDKDSNGNNDEDNKSDEGDEEDEDSKDKNDENDGNDENDEEDEEDEMTRIARMRKAYIMKVTRRMTGISP